jgi:hypothetical protein
VSTLYNNVVLLSNIIQLYFIKLKEEGLFNSLDIDIICILAIYMPIICCAVQEYIDI